MTLGDRIKTVRKNRDLTQREFAEKIGTTQNTIANYETGHRNPSAAALNNICKTFGIREEWLRTGEGEMFISMTRDEEIAAFVGDTLSSESDTFKKRFISILSKLKESDWEVLERMVEAMKKD